jgi:uncharacterized protein YxjI
MRYQVRQRVFSLSDRFAIKDEAGGERFLVQGRVFSLGKKLSLTDTSGNELYFIRQKLLSVLPCYHVLKDGREVAELRSRLSFLKARFSISGEKGSYDIEGSPLGLEYRISSGGREVATVSKRFFAVADTYGVDVVDSEDAAFVLSLVIIIDQIAHENRNH